MYMVNQRTTTAVREGYRDAAANDVEHQLAEARRTRAWLEGMHIDPDVRAWLVEPIAVVEEAFAEIARRGGGTEPRPEPG
jgi:hypothetical protein